MKLRTVFPPLVLFSSFLVSLKKKRTIKAGNDVFLRAKYKKAFPTVPINQPLRIEQIMGDKARVYWVTTKELLMETIPLKAISVVS